MHKLNYFGACLSVEIASWLICKDNSGMIRECPRNGDSLLFSSAKLVGQVLSTFFEAHSD